MVIRKVLDKLTRQNWRYHKTRMQVHSEVRGYSQHLKQNFWTLAVSTFGIATGLVWYDVWKAIIDEFFPNRNTLDLKFLVALIMTMISITGTYLVTRLQKKNGS